MGHPGCPRSLVNAMGTHVKPSFLGVRSPIFWGVKPSFFMGTWDSRVVCKYDFN